jgi:hypothetical protein
VWKDLNVCGSQGWGRVAVAMALGFAVVAGCGGGSSGGKAEFVAKGNELCKTLAADYAAGISKLGANPPKEQVAEFLRTSFVAEALNTYRSIGALDIPSGDRQTVEPLLTQVVAELSLIRADPAVGGNPANQRRLTAELGAYGLDQCGAGFATTANRTEFLTEANSICRDLNASYHKAYDDADLTLSSPPEDLKVVLHTRIVPLTRQALVEIEGIGFEDPTLQSIIVDTRALLDHIDADPERVTYGDTPDELAINKRWIDFGAGDCGGQLAAAAPPSS